VLFKETVVEELKATIAWSGSSVSGPDLMRSLGLTGLGPRHPRDLSAGQRLLVALAAIAACGAPLLLLDEPTRGLDHPSKEQLGRFLRKHSASGGAVLFATHDVELVAEIASRVVILAGGELIADGSPNEVIGDSPIFAPQMARVFGPDWLTPSEVASALALSGANE
jgi:energy-coupling factor transport system ATP-binding protein